MKAVNTIGLIFEYIQVFECTIDLRRLHRTEFPIITKKHNNLINGFQDLR